MLLSERIVDFVDVTYMQALHLTGNPEMSKDHTQEAIARVLQANIAPEDLSAAYMRVTVSNIIRNHWRDNQRMKFVDPEQLQKSMDSHEKQVLLRVELKFLRSQFTEQQWKIVTMLAEGYTYREIAEAVEITEFTLQNKIKAIIAKAKRIY